MSSQGWRVAAAVMVVVMGLVMGRPQDTVDPQREPSRNPQLNIWEFAILNNRNTFPTNRNAARSGVDRCTWAIVNCCRAPVGRRRSNCFQSMGCGGAVFDDLCSDDFVNRASGAVTQIFAASFAK